jgi:hypothetical protein
MSLRISPIRPTVRVVATGIIFALIGVTLIPEFGSEILEEAGVKSSRIWSPVFEGAFWYQLLVKAGNRSPRNKFVRIVELREHQGPDELFDNICKQRVLMAKLIHKLQIAEPSVIVIDKYFSPDSCRDEGPGNRMLKQVISNTKIPIVLGVHTLDSDDLKLLPDPLSPAEEERLKVAGLVEAQAMSFGNPRGLIDYGLIRLNHDNRKIPLKWEVYQSRSDLAAPSRPPKATSTLSFVAAQRADPDMATVSRLNSLLSKNSHPYTGVLSEDEIKTFSALDLVCGPNFPHPEDWEHCGSSDYGDEEIRHRVIIIGNKKANQDYHPSVIGDVPGVVLQANYIESLMDDRYLKPVSPWWNIGINLLAVFVIGCLFLLPVFRKHMGLSSTKAAIISLSIVSVLWVLSYLIVVTLGYYMAIWFPLLYILALWAHIGIEQVEEEEEEIEAREAKVA